MPPELVPLSETRFLFHIVSEVHGVPAWAVVMSLPRLLGLCAPPVQRWETTRHHPRRETTPAVTRHSRYSCAASGACLSGWSWLSRRPRPPPLRRRLRPLPPLPPPPPRDWTPGRQGRRCERPGAGRKC